jgi:hypothetical protein
MRVDGEKLAQEQQQPNGRTGELNVEGAKVLEMKRAAHRFTHKKWGYADLVGKSIAHLNFFKV